MNQAREGPPLALVPAVVVVAVARPSRPLRPPQPLGHRHAARPRPRRSRPCACCLVTTAVPAERRAVSRFHSLGHPLSSAAATSPTHTISFAHVSVSASIVAAQIREKSASPVPKPLPFLRPPFTIEPASSTRPLLQPSKPLRTDAS